eukprot:scaffold1578_cov350-Pavlova_lutheri.AAC.2
MLFRRRENILQMGLDGLPADPTSVSVTGRRQPVLRSCQPVPVERKAARGNACCTVSNPRRQDRQKREATNT